MKVQGSIAQNTCQTAKKFRQVTNLTKASTAFSTHLFAYNVPSIPINVN